MASAAMFHGTHAPKARTRTQARVDNNNKPSIWTRIKATAKRVVTSTKTGAVKATAKVISVTKRVALATKRGVVKATAKTVAVTKTTAKATASVSQKFWTRALKPVLNPTLY